MQILKMIPIKRVNVFFKNKTPTKRVNVNKR